MIARLAPLIVLLLSACPPSAPVPSGAQQVSVGPTVLGPEDIVLIKVHLEESLSGEFTVSEAGTLTFPFLGDLPVQGKTVNEVAATIREGLADGYLNDPQVSVTALEYNSRKISVIGEVRKPGRYPWREGMTLVQAIAEAGGTTTTAVLQYVQVTRTKDGEQYSVPFKDITLGRTADFPLGPGDVIFVQESTVK